MPIQIYILSKLIEDNTYPYKLKKQLSEPIPFDQLGGLTESKLYYHFDSLAKKGFIEPVEIIKEENRPDKQVFTITAKGREELPKKIYKLFETATTITEMLIGLVNMKYVNRDRVVQILEKKLKKLLTFDEHIRDIYKQMQIDKKSELLFEFVNGYITTRKEQTIHSLQELIVLIQQEKI